MTVLTARRAATGRNRRGNAVAFNAPAFTTPIKANPVLDVNSAAIAAALADVDENQVMETGDFGLPIYDADASTPRHQVGDAAHPLTVTALGSGDDITRSSPYPLNYTCTHSGYLYRTTAAGTTAGSAPTFPTAYGATIADGTVTWQNVGAGGGGYGNNDLATQSIPIPAGATPAPGSDAHIVVRDPIRRLVYCLWQAEEQFSGGGVTGGTLQSTDSWGTSGTPSSPYAVGHDGGGGGAATQITGNKLTLTYTGGAYGGNVWLNRVDHTGTVCDWVGTITLPNTSEFYTGVYVQTDAGFTQGYGVNLYSGGAQLQKRQFGSGNNLDDAVSDGALTANATIKIRMRRDTASGAVKCRWWTGATEPTTWQLTATDTAITAAGGYALVMASGSTSATYTTTVTSGSTFTTGATESAGVTTGWTCTWGGVLPMSGDGVAAIPNYAAAFGATWPTTPTSRPNGPGTSSDLGCIRIAELLAGRIDHALYFSSDITAGPRDTGPCRYPAVTTDGVTTTGTTIPEGARIQLDPSINLAAISGITAVELIVGRALQKYGAYCLDTGGSRIAISNEIPHDAAGRTAYALLGLTPDYLLLSHLPWGSLRVLASWDGN